ncbi:MAG: YceI family protein [Pirellulaceae bacterium]|nr:YceI family protein [Pirellulaceae bacterium]
MRLGLLSSLWMSLLLAVFLTTGPLRNLPAQDAAPQVISGELELKTSRVYVRVGKVGLGHEHGASCKLKSGELHLDQPDASGSYGKLVFDMTSFEADSDAARKYVGLEGSTDEATRKQVNENLLGKEVLDVEQYPTATFEAKRITKLAELSKRGLPRYKFEGDFTLHGITKPLEFAADVEVVKGWNHLRGGFAILQSAYGIKPYSKMLGAVGVTDRLLIYGDLIVAP